MGMFRRREDSEARDCARRRTASQGRLSSDVATLDAGDSPCPIRRGLEGITLSASCPVTTAVAHPHTATARPAGNSHCRVPPASRSAAAVTWTLPTPSTADQNPRKPPVVCRTPPFAGTAHTTARPTDARALIVHAPLVTLL